MSNDDYIYDYNGIKTAEIFTIVIASISALFPASVVFILLQQYDVLVRGKSLIHYVLMIAIADTLVSINIALGFPKSGILCSAQAFSLLFFGRMSWNFTLVLVFQLCFIVVYKKYFLNIKYMHIIVWTFTISLAFLPFSTGTHYGRSASTTEPVAVRCNFYNPNGDRKTADRWKQYSFRIELFTCFSMMTLLSIIVVIYSQCMNDSKTSHVYLAQRIRESWSTVILYPAAMLLTWVPSTGYGFFEEYFSNLPSHYYVISDYLTACQSLYGPLLAIIYYSKTQDARRAWLHNFKRMYQFITKADVDGEESRSTVASSHDMELNNSFSTTSKLKLWSQVKSPLSNNASNAATRIEEL